MIGSDPRNHRVYHLVRDALADGSLLPVLQGEIEQAGILTMLWPASWFRVPKIRVFVDCISRHMRPQLDISVSSRAYRPR
jgi:DNA-binding transcriptional LysR family regulator